MSFLNFKNSKIFTFKDVKNNIFVFLKSKKLIDLVVILNF
jgi:hypothetical protein